MLSSALLCRRDDEGIRYRGGILTFRLPDDWEGEQYGEGGAAYWGPGQRTGVLNLTLLTAQRPGARISEAISVVERGAAPDDPPTEQLATGNYLRRFERRTTEERDNLAVIFWVLVSAVEPNTVRIATFNLGIPVAFAGSAEHAAAVQMLDQELRAVRFTKLTPEQVETAQVARRPWWKFWAK